VIAGVTGLFLSVIIFTLCIDSGDIQDFIGPARILFLPG